MWKESFMTIANDRLDSLIMTKDPNILQNPNCTSRRLRWMSDDPPLSFSFRAFQTVAKASLPTFTTGNWMKCTLKMVLALANRRSPILLLHVISWNTCWQDDTVECNQLRLRDFATPTMFPGSFGQWLTFFNHLDNL